MIPKWRCKVPSACSLSTNLLPVIYRRRPLLFAAMQQLCLREDTAKFLHFCGTTKCSAIKFSTKSKASNKTYPWLIIACSNDSKYVLHEILATRAWKGRASLHGRFWPIRQKWAESAVLASPALPRPSCQDFMQYIFGNLVFFSVMSNQ